VLERSARRLVGESPTSQAIDELLRDSQHLFMRLFRTAGLSADLTVLKDPILVLLTALLV